MRNVAKDTRRILHDIVSPLTVVRWFTQKRPELTTALEKVDKLVAKIGELRSRLIANENSGDEFIVFFKIDAQSTTKEIRLEFDNYCERNIEKPLACDESGKIATVNQALDKIELLLEAIAGKDKPVKRCEMSDIVRSAVKEVRPYARRMGVKLKVRIAKTDSDADSETINRVLVNLINNAIEASGSKRVLVRLLNEIGFTRIETLDDGGGIATPDAHKVFDDGFTRGKIAGSGIGLSFCKDEIEKLGGSIALHSQNGIGTIFAVNLPKCSEAASPDDSISE